MKQFTLFILGLVASVVFGLVRESILVWLEDRRVNRMVDEIQAKPNPATAEEYEEALRLNEDLEKDRWISVQDLFLGDHIGAPGLPGIPAPPVLTHYDRGDAHGPNQSKKHYLFSSPRIGPWQGLSR